MIISYPQERRFASKSRMDSTECRQFRSGQLQTDDVRGGRNLLRVSRRRNGTSAQLQTGFFT